MLSWVNWQLDETQQQFLEFTRFLTSLFHQHPVLRRRKFFQGTPVLNSRIKDLTWFHPNADEITDEQWQSQAFISFGLLLAGDAIPDTDERGKRLMDDTMLILLNAAPRPCTFTLPDEPAMHLDDPAGHCWERMLDTRFAVPKPAEEHFAVDAPYTLEPLSLALFLWRKPPA
jgi:glycogen operon protein